METRYTVDEYVAALNALSVAPADLARLVRAASLEGQLAQARRNSIDLEGERQAVLLVNTKDVDARIEANKRALDALQKELEGLRTP